ncbi:MAG: heme ABC transporter ATP-binding protein [Chloroflexi bacterium]|nr:heme ABC transporter ATP-binding protein [Chloroflexota bacterium]MCL5275908.1 heme ABC transporter ATP-binding protein [Chloroflexota bacterium]
MLTIEHLSAAYGKRMALSDICMEARAGEIVGVMGSNGAGKSSLLHAISGTLAPAQGRVLLNGADLSRVSVDARARQIAVAPQSSHLPGAFTVGEVVLMGRTPHLPFLGAESAHDYEIVNAALTRTATEALAERRIGELSGGEQQRVLIARALAQITGDAGAQPCVLLLDEATAHLDMKHQAAIWELVRQLARSGLIVIAALHDLNLAAQYADRLALLSGGRLLACDRPSQVLTPEWLRRTYDISTTVISHPLYGTPLVALTAEGEPKCNRDL